MLKFSRVRMLGCALIAVAISAVAFAPVASAGPTKVTPKKYYLALGDSLAFGYQGYKVVSPFAESQFQTGYVDDLTTYLKTIKPDIQTVNKGCPGATSTELISVAGCTTYPFQLHSAYAPGKSQLQDSITFLNANAGKVSPISLNIGPNDILRLINGPIISGGCGGLGNPNVIACLTAAAPALFNSIATNVGNTLGQLKAAAPGANIILQGLYNPYAVVPGFGGPSNALATQLNAVLASVAAGAGATFVDVFPTINASLGTVCAYTLMCPPSPGAPDIHASDAGYQKLADLMWTASGYAAITP